MNLGEPQEFRQDIEGFAAEIPVAGFVTPNLIILFWVLFASMNLPILRVRAIPPIRGGNERIPIFGAF